MTGTGDLFRSRNPSERGALRPMVDYEINLRGGRNRSETRHNRPNYPCQPGDSSTLAGIWPICPLTGCCAASKLLVTHSPHHSSACGVTCIKGEFFNAPLSSRLPQGGLLAGLGEVPA